MTKILGSKEIVRRENFAVLIVYPVILFLSGLLHTVYNPSVNQFAQTFLISFIYLIGFLGLLQLYHAQFRVEEERAKFVYMGCFMVGMSYILIETSYAWLSYFLH